MSTSKAFDGFVIITGILCIAMFLLAIQLPLISLDSTYKNWHDILQGNGRFPEISNRADAKTVMFHREPFFANNKLDISYANLSALKNDLHRERHFYKWIVVYADLVITAGGLLLWIIMVVAIFCKKLERFFTCARGLFIILAGLFFIVCSVWSFVICILANVEDLDDYDDMLIKGLKTVVSFIQNCSNLMESSTGATRSLTEMTGDGTEVPLNLTSTSSTPRNMSEAERDGKPGSEVHLKESPCDVDDNNENGTVRLSPQTWFLIVMECLISKGKTVPDVLRDANMKENETDVEHLIKLAKNRKGSTKPIVEINGVPYSRWTLEQLQFCPEDSVKPTIHLFLAFVLFLAFLVAIHQWKDYGRRKSEKKPKEDAEAPEPILTEEPPEVIGSNNQMAEGIASPSEPPHDQEDKSKELDKPKIMDPKK